MDNSPFDFAHIVGVLPISTDCNQPWQYTHQNYNCDARVAGNDVEPRPPLPSK